MAYFDNKLAYITGGSSGIGLETAKLLASQGCSVILMARNSKKLEEAATTIGALTPSSTQRVDFISVDVSDNKDVQKKIDEAVERFGIPDILINSAGTAYGDYFENIKFDDFDRVMKINVYGTWNIISTLLPYMKQKKAGHIVNLSSLAGLIGMFGYSLYGTTKFAVAGMSEILRSELKRYNIRVTVVCPPEVTTPLLEQEKDTLPPEGRAVKNLAGLLKPEQVAKTIVKGIKRKKFLVIPGVAAKFLYFNHRISNGLFTRVPADLIASFTAWRLRRQSEKNLPK